MEKDIKEFIENLSTYTEDEVNAICTSILFIKDIDQMKETTSIFLDNFLKYLIENKDKYTDNELTIKINQIVTRLSLNETTREILEEKEFKAENILNKIEKIDKSNFDKINDKINSMNELNDDIILNIMYEMDNLYEEKNDNSLSNENYNILLDNFKNKTKDLISIKFNNSSDEEKENIFNELNEKLEQKYKIFKERIIEEEFINNAKNSINNLNDLNTEYIATIINDIEKLSFNTNISHDNYVKLNNDLQQKIENLIDIKYPDKNIEEKNNIFKTIANESETLYKKIRDNDKENEDEIIEDEIIEDEIIEDEIIEDEIIKDEKEINKIKKLIKVLPTQEEKANLNEKLGDLKEFERIYISRIKKNIPEKFINSSNYLSEINNEITLIETEIKNLNSTPHTKDEIQKKSKAELMETINKLTEYKSILNARLNRARPDEIDSIKNELINITDELNKSHKEYNKILYGNGEEKAELMETINKLTEYKSILNARLNRARPDEIDSIKNELNNVTDKLNKSHKEYNKILYGDDEEKKDINNKDKKAELIKRLEELKYSKKEILEATELLEKTKKEIINVGEELNKTFDKDRYNEIINTYNQIINDTTNNFSNDLSENISSENIMDYVNNHKNIDIINNYENSDKLKKELLEEIKNKLNISKNKDENNKITKKSNDKRKWLKAIQAVAGFATGLAFSCAPGVGIITMGLAGAKLGVSAINFLSKKNPEGKITKFIEKNKNKFTNIAENKFPGITEKANNMRNKIKDFYDKYEIKYFLNGMAAGYLTGNLVEIFTGETVLEHAKNLFNNNSGNISQVAPGKITPGNVTPENVPTTELLSTNISDFAGQNFDLSSVPQGFVSSYSDTPVNLITESAKNLSFDKANFVNGEEWWHFLKPDGQGYAWFKADDVRHLVEGAIKSGKSI